MPLLRPKSGRKVSMTASFSYVHVIPLPTSSSPEMVLFVSITPPPRPSSYYGISSTTYSSSSHALLTLREPKNSNMARSNFSTATFLIHLRHIWVLHSNSVRSTQVATQLQFPVWEGALLLIQEVAPVPELCQWMTFPMPVWSSICLFGETRSVHSLYSFTLFFFEIEIIVYFFSFCDSLSPIQPA